MVARACASFSGGEGHASRRFGSREEEEEEEEDAFSERATWRALLAADNAAESARATVVASRVVAFALASLAEHDECALGANEAGALARAVIALTASPSVSKRALFSRPSHRGGGVQTTGDTRSDAAEVLRAASISRRRCASTAKLLEVLWTRVVVLTDASKRSAAGIGIGSDSDGFTYANAANAAFAAQLISLPRVWRRGGDPATTWASSVATLFPMTREASSRVSFPDPPFAEDRRRGHSGYAAAWALGNLVEGASAGLETCGSRVEKWRAATRFAEVAASLLRRLPPGTTLSSSVVAEMDDAEMDDAEIERGEIDACSPMDAEDAEVSSESDGGSASDDEDDEGAARAAARRRRAFVAGSTFRSVHPDARAQIVSALDPGFLKMLVDACLVDARPADAAPDEGGNAFAVPSRRTRRRTRGTPSFRPPRRRRTRLARARFPPSSPRSPRGSGPRIEAR